MLENDPFAKISDIVKLYVEGMCQNDAGKLRAAMHEKACVIGYYDGGLEWDTRDAFIAAVGALVDTPDPTPWFAIAAMSVTGDVATVQVEDIFLGQHYDDTLTLLRHGDRWCIVSKVFYLRPAL